MEPCEREPNHPCMQLPNRHTEGNSVLKSQDKQRSLRSPHRSCTLEEETTDCIGLQFNFASITCSHIYCQTPSSRQVVVVA